MAPDQIELIFEGRPVRYVKATPAVQEPTANYLELAMELLSHPDVIREVAIRLREEGQ